MGTTVSEGLRERVPLALPLEVGSQETDTDEVGVEEQEGVGGIRCSSKKGAYSPKQGGP